MAQDFYVRGAPFLTYTNSGRGPFTFFTDRRGMGLVVGMGKALQLALAWE